MECLSDFLFPILIIILILPMCSPGCKTKKRIVRDEKESKTDEGRKNC